MEQEILAAAYRLFAPAGYDETPVERIAAESGVSVQEFRRYFESKDATLERIGFCSVERALRGLPPEPSTAEIIRRLASWVRRASAGDRDVTMRSGPSLSGALATLRALPCQ